jgi:hypothetical protein
MILVGKHNRKLMLGEYTERGFSKNRTGMMDWIYLAHDRDQWCIQVNVVMDLWVT